jgi:hypothetical protein
MKFTSSGFGSATCHTFGFHYDEEADRQTDRQIDQADKQELFLEKDAIQSIHTPFLA